MNQPTSLPLQQRAIKLELLKKNMVESSADHPRSHHTPLKDRTEQRPYLSQCIDRDASAPRANVAQQRTIFRPFTLPSGLWPRSGGPPLQTENQSQKLRQNRLDPVTRNPPCRRPARDLANELVRQIVCSFFLSVGYLMAVGIGLAHFFGEYPPSILKQLQGQGLCDELEAALAT